MVRLSLGSCAGSGVAHRYEQTAWTRPSPSSWMVVWWSTTGSSQVNDGAGHGWPHAVERLDPGGYELGQLVGFARVRPRDGSLGQSPLFLAVEVEPDATVHLFFGAPREAPTTRGFAGILHTGLGGLSADEVLATPAEFTSQLGLQDLVSPLRLRGMAAMLARIKRHTRERRS
jgi:Fe-S metabolism associated domain